VPILSSYGQTSRSIDVKILTGSGPDADCKLGVTVVNAERLGSW